MKNLKLCSCLCLLILIACGKSNKVDLIVKGAKIYTIDSMMSIASVMVINQGKIVEVGTEELLKKYQSDSVLEAEGKFIYPGLIDAHAHFYGLGSYMQTVDLANTKSWDEVIARCENFVSKNKPQFLTGRGWDQNDWAVKKFPTNDKLNQLFPDIPVLLKRVDGHAAIANNKALALAQLNTNTKIDGGELIKNANTLTGVLIDNAVDLVQEKYPKPNRVSIASSLLKAQEICIDLGLTSVCDAGLDTEVIEVIDSLQKCKQLFIRVYP